MKLTVIRNLFFAAHHRAYKVGDPIELPDDVAAHWVGTGAAKPVVDVPQKEAAVVNMKRKRETREAK